MTPEQHNKYLGISHLIHGGLSFLMMIGMMIFMSIAMSFDPNPPPAGMLVIMWIFMAVITLVFYTPSLIAGVALLKRKRWAKTAGIVAGVLASMSAPIGTAVCAYTFWFLFSQPGKSLYDAPKQALPPMPPSWYANSTQSREREPVYTPSSTPPDWR